MLVFGHLPLMTLSHYTALQGDLRPTFLAASAEQRENIKRLAWFSTELQASWVNSSTGRRGGLMSGNAGEMVTVRRVRFRCWNSPS